MKGVTLWDAVKTTAAGYLRPHLHLNYLLLFYYTRVPGTESGKTAWDSLQTLAETCRKLGISFYRYIHSRLTKSDEVAALATVIRARALELNLSGSWATL